ncbi:MAG: hypothetical protein R2879_14650 [Saprospiraceae bacterium]
MKLRHFIFSAFLIFSIGLNAQSFQAGLSFDLQSKGGNGYFWENFSSPVFLANYESSTNSNQAKLFPGVLFTYNFKNGNILEARFQGIYSSNAILPFNSPVKTDANYELVGGLDFYKRINSIQSSKASFYFGGGLGYTKDRIAISGFDALEGYESYVNRNGMLFSGGFRTNVQFVPWFALMASANLQLFEFFKETRFTRFAIADGSGTRSIENDEFISSFYSYFRIGTLFTIYSKK